MTITAEQLAARYQMALEAILALAEENSTTRIIASTALKDQT